MRFWKKSLLACVGAMAAYAAPVCAADFPAEALHMQFLLDTTMSGSYGNTGMAAGEFSDTYTFVVDRSGIASATVTTSAAVLLGSVDLDLYSFQFNDVLVTPFSIGSSEYAFALNVPVTAGIPNRITITGLSRGNGSYGGSLNWLATSEAPEPATWSMMLVGFGSIGFALRRARVTADKNRTTVATL